MTWFASSPNEVESQKEHVRMFVAVDFDFPSEHVRLWSGAGEITIDGFTYSGVGELGRISAPSENDRLVAEQKTYQVSGADPAQFSEDDIDGCFGRSVTEYFGFLDTVTGALVDEPEINWEGRIDQIRRTDGGDPVIEISAEHRTVMLDQADGTRYTHEHQQSLFPGDNGFDQIASINIRTVVWGGQRVQVGTAFNGKGAAPVYD